MRSGRRHGELVIRSPLEEAAQIVAVGVQRAPAVARQKRDADAHGLAEALADALEERGGWYADFHSDSEVTAVFAGRIFRYHRGDGGERAKVEAYARSVGVPEEQLDWDE